MRCYAEHASPGLFQKSVRAEGLPRGSMRLSLRASRSLRASAPPSARLADPVDLRRCRVCRTLARFAASTNSAWILLSAPATPGSPSRPGSALLLHLKKQGWDEPHMYSLMMRPTRKDIRFSEGGSINRLEGASQHVIQACIIHAVERQRIISSTCSSPDHCHCPFLQAFMARHDPAIATGLCLRTNNYWQLLVEPPGHFPVRSSLKKGCAVSEVPLSLDSSCVPHSIR